VATVPFGVTLATVAVQNTARLIFEAELGNIFELATAGTAFLTAAAGHATV
jgi:hypothetical protein